MADTLISRLGNNREIVVRPLSSVRNFGKLEQDAIETGRSLDVASVLEGSIQRWGDKIRVNVRLIKVADGTMLWTETFDEKFTDIFVVQDAISSRVAKALALRLSGEEKTTVEKRFTNSAEAYAFYLRGRYHFFKITEPEIRTGIAFYEQAIQVDPNYALAYAGMADAYRTLAIAGFARSKDVCPQAMALAQRALAIDESLAEGHIVLGWIGFLYDWDWPSAEKELERAIELSPNNSEAHRAYAHLLSNSGRHDEAIAEGRRARELAPLTLISAALEGQFLFYAGHDAEAIERLNQTLELDPDFWVAHSILGRVYIRQGRFAEAITELQKAKELSSRSTEPIMQLGYAFAKSGDRNKAVAAIRELESLSTTKLVPAYNFAMIYNSLGDTEKALDMLEKSREDRDIQLAFLKVDTRWNNLRSEPRFIELMNQMNFRK
jgi:serine/threonine-protein kinase